MNAPHPRLTAPPPSLMARLDPRVRVVGAILFTVAALAAESGAALGAALALAVVLGALARLKLGATLRRLAGLEGFMVVVLVLLPFSIPGTPVAELWGMQASAEGIRRALVLLAKANAVTLAVLALLGSMEAVSLGHALARLGVPERFVVLFVLTARYITVLHQEFARLRLAMKARGFRMTTSLHTWRSMGWLVGMLLVNSLARAERIHAAMRCRGYSGRFHLDGAV